MFDQPNKIKRYFILLLIYFISGEILSIANLVIQWGPSFSMSWGMPLFIVKAYVPDLLLIGALIWAYRYENKETSKPDGLRGGLLLIFLIMARYSYGGIRMFIGLILRNSFDATVLNIVSMTIPTLLAIGYILCIILILKRKTAAILMIKIIIVGRMVNNALPIYPLLNWKEMNYGRVELWPGILGTLFTLMFYICCIGLVFEYLNKSHRVRNTLTGEMKHSWKELWGKIHRGIGEYE